MNKRLFTIMTVLLIAVLATSPVSALGKIGLNGALSKGSLHFDGTMTGLGGYTQGVTVLFTGYGQPVVKCVNDDDGHEEDGENASFIKVFDEQVISSKTTVIEKGKAPVDLVIENSDIQLPHSGDGCQSYREHDDEDDWTAVVIDVIWKQATVDVYFGANIFGNLLRHQEYMCDQATQTPTYISCKKTTDISYH